MEQLKERFERMSLPYEAYRFITIFERRMLIIIICLVRLNMLEFKHRATVKPILVASQQRFIRS